MTGKQKKYENQWFSCSIYYIYVISFPFYRYTSKPDISPNMNSILRTKRPKHKKKLSIRIIMCSPYIYIYYIEDRISYKKYNRNNTKTHVYVGRKNIIFVKHAYRLFNFIFNTFTNKYTFKKLSK